MLGCKEPHGFFLLRQGPHLLWCARRIRSRPPVRMGILVYPAESECRSLLPGYVGSNKVRESGNDGGDGGKGERRMSKARRWAGFRGGQKGYRTTVASRPPKGRKHPPALLIRNRTFR